MLHCDDGAIAEFPTRMPMPVVKTGQVRPREHVDRDRCMRAECRRLAWQHWTVRP
jgi:hypothetical protein